MGERRPVLLTVSGTIPDDLDERVAVRDRPRADYRVLAARLDADVIDVPGALARTGRLGRLLHRLGGAPALLGWYVFRRRRSYEVILTDGEQVGLPFALLSRLFGRGGSRHVMIVHILTVPKKARLVRWARLANIVDRYLVYCSLQGELLRAELGVEDHRVVLTPFMVDTEFFSGSQVTTAQRRMICSAGLERRDYPTLMAAVDGLDVEVVIAAASPWSKQADSTQRREIPANVTIERLSLFDLRELYAASRFVVMPLYHVDFQAGITSILEAMSMERAVVCTRTPGQTDTIVDGETGIYVPPGDPDALRSAIESLLDDEDEARRLGRAARAWAVEHAELDRYAEGIAAVVASLRAAPG
jgi:glycosyltransferase involved in cell wall biosynthesis